MDAFNDIIALLEKQKEAIEAALTALRQVDGAAAATVAPAKRSYTRRVVKVAKVAKVVKAVKAVKKSGGISEAGRKSLSEAMKQRWAAKRAGTAVKVKKARKKSAAKKTE